MKIAPLALKKKFHAPIEKVFESWSNPEAMKQWFKPDSHWQVISKNTFKVGGTYEHVMKSKDGKEYIHTGEYKEIIRPTKLVFTWNSEVVKNTLVTIELKEVDGYTELTLTHDLFPTEDIKEQHNQGWNGCLENLLHHLS
ncbi:MAG: SRPBCC domain-containing protein [Alphaproteobacteria bacterium]|nr:SRPBCC domain-containing protein [Alphaproteobacteria bacterium]